MCQEANEDLSERSFMLILSIIPNFERSLASTQTVFKNYEADSFRFKKVSTIDCYFITTRLFKLKLNELVLPTSPKRLRMKSKRTLLALACDSTIAILRYKLVQHKDTWSNGNPKCEVRLTVRVCLSSTDT